MIGDADDEGASWESFAMEDAEAEILSVVLVAEKLDGGGCSAAWRAEFWA